MAFRVGMKVVCVDDGGNPEHPDLLGWRPEAEIKRGEIYTVRALGTTPLLGRPGIKLVERRLRGSWSDDQCYRADRFRPAVEPSTDISWAHEIVRTVFERSPELALAARLRGE